MQAEATARAAAAVSGGAAGVGAGEGVAAGEAGDAALLAEVMRHVAAERAARQLEARLMQARATDYNVHLATSLIQHAPCTMHMFKRTARREFQAATNAEAAERACRAAKERRLLAALHRADVRRHALLLLAEALAVLPAELREHPAAEVHRRVGGALVEGAAERRHRLAREEAVVDGHGELDTQPEGFATKELRSFATLCAAPRLMVVACGETARKFAVCSRCETLT